MIVSGFGMHILITADYVDGMSIDDSGEMQCFKYPRTMKENFVIIRISTSLISSEQAIISMNRELPLSKSFNDIALIAKNTWNK